MYPPAASIMRNNARAKEDLPAPVLPTIPIFSPGFTEQVNSFKTRGRPGLYRVSYSWNVNFPSWGQSARGWFSMFVQSAWKKLYLYSIEIARHHFHFGDTCCSEINHVNQRFDAQLVIFCTPSEKNMSFSYCQINNWYFICWFLWCCQCHAKSRSFVFKISLTWIV